VSAQFQKVRLAAQKLADQLTQVEEIEGQLERLLQPAQDR
jgi:hypothetical protein